MKKDIVLVKEKENTIQITCADERFYAIPSNDEKTALPIYKYYPSVSWISSFYPKNKGFWMWLASKGWDESQEIMATAGDKGSKVHQGIASLLSGNIIKMDSKFTNPSKNTEEELSLEEYECLMSFVAWHEEAKPSLISNEFVVINKEHEYAGTVDALFLCGTEKILVDFKTSSEIWPSHKLQLSAYKHALEDQNNKLAILQLGYRRNKKKFKFTEIDDCFDLFLSAKKIWEFENTDVKPRVIELPTQLKLKGEQNDNRKCKNPVPGLLTD